MDAPLVDRLQGCAGPAKRRAGSAVGVTVCNRAQLPAGCQVPGSTAATPVAANRRLAENSQSTSFETRCQL